MTLMYFNTKKGIVAAKVALDMTKTGKPIYRYCDDDAVYDHSICYQPHQLIINPTTEQIAEGNFNRTKRIVMRNKSLQRAIDFDSKLKYGSK